MVYSPLEQFEILPLLTGSLLTVHGSSNLTNHWLFTNMDLTFLVGLVEFLVLLAVLGNSTFFSLVFNRCAFFLGEVVKMVVGSVGKVGQTHVGIVVTLLVFIVLFNVLGLVPFGFCVTSHIVVTQFLGVFAVGGLTLKGIQNLGFKWLNLFVPRNVPLAMLPFLGLIELVSYASRALSLSIRLFANMVAGHALLHILMGALLNVFTLQLGGVLIGFIFFFPFLLILAISVLELGIAFLQGYVFVTLYLIYTSDSLYSH